MTPNVERVTNNIGTPMSVRAADKRDYRTMRGCHRMWRQYPPWARHALLAYIGLSGDEQIAAEFERENG